MWKIGLPALLLGGLAVGFTLLPDSAPAGSEPQASNAFRYNAFGFASNALVIQDQQTGTLYFYTPDRKERTSLRLFGEVDLSKTGQESIPFRNLKDAADHAHDEHGDAAHEDTADHDHGTEAHGDAVERLGTDDAVEDAAEDAAESVEEADEID